jgi:pilus assembly protein CpaE
MKFLAVINDEAVTDLVANVSKSLNITSPTVVTGGIADAVKIIMQSARSPEYIMIDIGIGSGTLLEEIDNLAENCEPHTKVVIIGDINDLNLYRQLLQRGVIEYFVKPVNSNDVKSAFSGTVFGATKASTGNANGKIISFMAAASGDGATTVAINTAYSLATDFNQPTVLVDMDYQYGMVARNLDLVSNHGFKELVEQPEGAIDAAMIDKTLVKYSDNLYVISAPKPLRFIPKISNQTMTDMLTVLRHKFKNVIVDLPHVWMDFVSHVIGETDKNMMVAQLWIKSAAHASRFLDVSQSLGITLQRTSVIINRSGSKFKEAISPAEFSTACKKKVDFYVSNETKTIITAENQGKSAIEMGNSALNKQFKEIAENITQTPVTK